MSRVLFVSTSTTVGGAEKTVYSLATLLDPKEFVVAGVVSLKPFGPYAERLKAQGVKLETLQLSGRPGLRHVRALNKLIAHERPDIVHAVMYQAIQLCRMAKKSGSARFALVSSPRVNYRTRSAATLFIDGLLKGADDLLIAESQATRDWLVKRLRYDPERIRVIYNGVDLASWPPSRLQRQQKRLELRMGAGELLIGCVGRLDAQKAHWVLVEAMAKLKNRVPARCVIIGDGPKRAALEALVHKHHLEGTVALLGERDDVTAWLSSLDAFALPSIWEGLPNALLEAMALGLPVVASAVDGVPEVVADGVNGLLVPARQPQALADKLALLCTDAGARARLGEAAKKTISERFTLLNMLSAYQQAYRDVLTSRHS